MRSHADFNRKVFERYQQWMAIQHYSVGTKYIYRQSIRLFLEFLVDKNIAEVTHLDVRRFMFYLAENGVSLMSARKHLVSLRRFYDFLNLGGVVNYVAPRLVTVRQLPKRQPLHLSEQEVKRLIEVAATTREKALVEFLYGTGCRVSEARNLQVQDVDLDAHSARVTGKYGKSRIVLLTKSCAEAMRAYIGNRKIGYVFQQDYPLQRGTISNSNGAWRAQWHDYSISDPTYTYTRRYLGSANIISYERARAKFNELVSGACLDRPKRNAPLTTTSVGNILRRIARRAGIKRATAHMYRHSFATHLYENGADLLAIQTLLGHVRMESTATYARTSAFKLVDTFERCHPLGSQHVKSSRKGSASLAKNSPIQKM